MNIPKKIHYCWFGGNPLSELAKKCINSWKQFFPDYEIIQWDETNFDVNKTDFMKKAYMDKKWAFVSDVARLLIVYENGGLYFDTDVEVIKSFDDILSDGHSAFFGFEKEGIVSSGLGFGAEKGNQFLKELFQVYADIDYNEYREDLAKIACPVLTTRFLEENGLKKNNLRQDIDGVTIYPWEYFAPMDYFTGKIKKTKNTHTVHWYSASWQTGEQHRAFEKSRRMNRLFGRKISDNITGIITCIKKEGFWTYLCNRLKKILKKKK